jgi:uncharacterized protein YbjT (DUF2867 family)
MGGRALAVFGISGASGQALALAALARGWTVRGLLRPSTPVPPTLSGCTLVRGGFDGPGPALETLDGCAAVACVLGPRPPWTDAFCAPATAVILEAMRVGGVRRLVCQTGAMIGPGERSFFFGAMRRHVARGQAALFRDRERQEQQVMASGLEWTLLKPPRLTEGPPRWRIECGTALRMGLLDRLRRSDLADFALDAIEGGRHIGERLFLRER